MQIRNRLVGAYRSLMNPTLKGTEWEAVFRKGLEWRMGQGSLDQPYKQSVWVYIGIRAISTNVAQVPFELWKGGSQGTQITSGPVYDLFNWVNPSMSSTDLWEATTVYLLLRGECIWLLEKSRGQAIQSPGSLPSAIYPYSTDMFRRVYDKDRRVIGWVYKNTTGAEIPLTLDEVILFKLFNPYDQNVGLSPLDAIRLSTESDYAAQLLNRNLLRNDASPGGIISFEKGLTDAQWKRLQEQWEARHQGVSKAGRVAILEGGAKWQNMSLNSKQLEFLDGRRMNREEILGALGVPKTIVSLTDDLNYAIAQAHKKIFWSDTILPLLAKYESRVKTDFFDRFLSGQNIVGLFNTENVSELQEDLKEKADIAKSFYEMGVPFNQINERLDLGFEDVPGGDEPKPTGGGSLLYELPEEDLEFKDEPVISIKKGKKLPLNTIEERQATWHQLQGYMLPFRTKFVHKSRELWKEMKSDTVKRVEENWKKRDFSGWSKKKVDEALQKQSLNDMIFELDTFRREWRSRMRGTIVGATNEAGTRALELVEMGRVFDVSDPEVIHWIEQRGMALATSVTETAAEEIRLILIEGYQDGLSVADMSRTISSYFDVSEAYKAERIARTEIAFAQTEGSREAYRQSEIVVGMEWLANPDACPDCAMLDGREFDKNTDAGPPQHPNCECTLLPITREE